MILYDVTKVQHKASSSFGLWGLYKGLRGAGFLICLLGFPSHAHLSSRFGMAQTQVFDRCHKLLSGPKPSDGPENTARPGQTLCLCESKV